MRTRVVFPVDVFRDETIRGLPPDALAVYFVVLRAQDVSAAGTLPYAPRRWLRFGAGWTPERMRAACETLVDAGLLMIDLDAGEAWLPRWIDEDNILTQPSIALAAVEAVARLESAAIAEQVRSRYGKALTEASARAWRGGRRRRATAQVAASQQVDPQATSQGVTDPASQGVTQPADRSTGMGMGTGSTSSSSRSQSSTPTRRRAATRRELTDPPDNMLITEPLRAWAVKNAPDVKLDRETQAFLDYYRSTGIRRKDWTAAWRKWMLKAQDDAERRPARRGAAPVPAGRPGSPYASKIDAFSPNREQQDILVALPDAAARRAQIAAWLGLPAETGS